MNAITANSPRRVTLAYGLLLGIVVIFLLMLYAALRYPASLSQGGLVSFLANPIASAASASHSAPNLASIPS